MINIAEKLNVASIGVGRIVRNRLVDGIGKSQHCVYVGGWDPNVTNDVTTFLRERNATPYSTQEALLADHKVNIVLVASPHHLHYLQAKAALEAGKHAWVEKPLATRPNEAYELGQLASTKDLGLWVDSMMKNNWLNQLAAQMIAGGEIGTVLRVETNMEFPYVEDNFRYQEKDSEGGGALWDVGPHCLYMAMMLTGAKSIDAISARFGRQITKETDPHQSTYMVYTMDNRVFGVSNTSFVTHWMGLEKNLYFRVIGTEGVIEGYGTLFQHSETCAENDQHLVVYDKDGRREIRTPKEGVPNIYAVELDKLAGPIRRGEKPPINREAISLVGVINAALNQARAEMLPGAYTGDAFKYHP